MEELDLKGLFNIFWSKRIYIVLIIAIFAVIGIIYSFAFVTPEYKAETTLVLAKTDDEQVQDQTGTSTGITQTDITLNQKLVSTYSELIRGKRVLKEVISNLKIDETEESLKKKITVSQKKDTEIIQIDVVHEDPQQAKAIAGEIVKAFAAEVERIYSINNVHIVDEAEVPLEPYNINHIKDIAIFMAIGVIVSIAYVLVSNMLDTTIKYDEDIEKNLKLTVLATIPLYSQDDKGGRR